MTLFKKPTIRFSDETDRTKSGPSFPSGHVTDNVIIATICTLFFRRWGWLYFFVAAAVGYSRIYLGAHWPSDVIATVFMALGHALLMVALLEFLWRRFAPRWAPRLFARHPSLRWRKWSSRHFMSNTKAVWFFILGLTAIRLTLLGTTDLTFDEAHYWMWSERLAPSYFSKGPGVAFAIRASTAIFGDTEFGVRFWSPILGAGTSLLIYYFTRRLFNATAGFWAVLAINAIPLFNIGNIAHDDRSALDLFLDGGHVHLLAGPRAEPEFFLALAADRSARRARVSLQIHERLRARLHRARPGAGPALAAGIQAARPLSSSRRLRALHWCRRSSGTRSTPGSRWRICVRGGAWITRSAFIRASCSDFSPRIFSFFRRSSFWGSPGPSSRTGAARASNSRCSISSGSGCRSSRFISSSRSTSRRRRTGTCSLSSVWGVLAAAYWHERLAASARIATGFRRRLSCSGWS